MKLGEMVARLLFVSAVGGLLTAEGAFCELETARLQGEIDAVAAQGGGVVCIAPGDHLVGSLHLRSGVTLDLPEGARLVASTNSCDYMTDPRIRPNNRAVITGYCVTNVAIVGKGEIDGRGAFGPIGNEKAGRWRNVHLVRSAQVRIEDITLRDCSRWNCYLQECDGVTVRHVKIRSNVNWNNDGLDLETTDTLVEDCDIVCGDDGICFKNDNPDYTVENCVVRNCRVSSNCNFIKFGTSGFGLYRNIVVSNCWLECVAETPHLDWRGWLPGVTEKMTGISGLCLEVVDGGRMENIVIRDITMGKGVQTPIFIRQHARHRPQPGRTSELKDVLIENVKMTAPAASLVACSITGIPGLRPHDIVLRNLDLIVPGGATAEQAAMTFGEEEKCYPENRQFGKNVTLPAYGFYVRHADNVHFENVKVRTVKPDARQPFVFDDADGCTVEGVAAKGIQRQ